MADKIEFRFTKADLWGGTIFQYILSTHGEKLGVQFVYTDRSYFYDYQPNVTDNSWKHIAYIFDQNNIYVYVNGALISSHSITKDFYSYNHP